MSKSIFNNFFCVKLFFSLSLEINEKFSSIYMRFANNRHKRTHRTNPTVLLLLKRVFYTPNWSECFSFISGMIRELFSSAFARTKLRFSLITRMFFSAFGWKGHVYWRESHGFSLCKHRLYQCKRCCWIGWIVRWCDVGQKRGKDAALTWAWSLNNFLTFKSL